MSQTPFVLKALKILGPEEMLKLTEVLQVEQVPLKMAAGEELIVWDEVSEKPSVKAAETEAKILPFPKKSIHDLIPLEEESPEDEGEQGPTNLLTSELILWQREITKEAGGNNQKLNAFKGYKKSTEMYVVKSADIDGKDKIRFAETNGILINKKQA
jgi:hypothetical protein